MKIKSLALGLTLGGALLTIAVPLQAASCHKYKPGWHMVSKKCPIKPADNWQEYKSGVYIQPMTGKGIF